MITTRIRGGLALCLLLGVALLPTERAAAQSVLRVSPHADLKVLDPHTNTATITIMHAHMIYDTLFSWDEQLKPQPQMVQSWTVSPDKLIYDFTLRPNLKFHDGQPVTARDVVPSVKRWMVRDAMGQKLGEFTAEMSVLDDARFRIRLKEPFAFVELALGTSSGMVPAIMREKDAATDAFKLVTETVGSGPFRFVRGEWVPGVKTVYEKNTDYVARAEPPSGMAGGKTVKVDRVEWLVLPDSMTKASALQKGEIDIIDQLTLDQIPVVAKFPNVTVKQTTQIDSYGIIRPNHLHPPFNHPKARQALALMIDQKEYLHASSGDDPSWWRECWSFFVCDSPNTTEAGAEAVRKRDIARAKQLLAEAGYKGEKVVMLATREIPAIGALGDVTAGNLKAIGINLEIQESDWGTMVTRRTKKDPPERGGWHIFHTTVAGGGMYSPITNFATNAACEGNAWFGWPCDEKAEALKLAYIRAPDEAGRRQALEALHARLWEVVPLVPTGQYKQPHAWRNAISGMLRASSAVYWGIEKR